MQLLDDPGSSRTAAWLSYAVVATILLSTASYIAESFPALRGSAYVFTGIEVRTEIMGLVCNHKLCTVLLHCRVLAGAGAARVLYARTDAPLPEAIYDVGRHFIRLAL